MNVLRMGTLITGTLAAILSGCAHTPSCGPIAPRPSVSGFANCDCGPAAGLPRVRSRSGLPPVVVPGVPPSTAQPPLVQPPITQPPVTQPPVTQPPPAQPPFENPQARPPAQPPVDDYRTYPPSEPKWRPSPDTSIKPFAPAPLPPTENRDPKAELRPPQIGESQRPAEQPRPAEPPAEPPADPNILPVDIPQFAYARKDVASGQKPFADGLDWLRKKGYRTVLFVRAPGEDDSAARRQFTDKGFTYLSLEVSPNALSREVIDEFNRIVTTQANLPLFCYDRDSSLLGGLWYLHFRLQAGYDHEKASIKAGELGLNVDADGGPHREMWLAIQRYLQMSKPTGRPLSKVHTAVWTRER